MTSGASATNSAAYLRMEVGFACGPARIDVHVAAVGPAQLLQASQERCVARLTIPYRLAAVSISTPMRRIRSGCCARAVSGYRRRASHDTEKFPSPHVPPLGSGDGIVRFKQVL